MKTRHGEEGSILILSLLLTLVVLGVGLTAMWISSSGTKISANLTRQQEAMQAAEAGLERARWIVSNGNWETLLRAGDGGAGNCNITLSPATPHEPDNPNRGNVLCDPNMVGVENMLFNVPVIESGTTTHGVLGTTYDRMVYTVYIRNDPSEYAWCNGVAEPSETTMGITDTGDCNGDTLNDATDRDMRLYQDRDQRVIIRSEGIARDGASYAAIEITLSAQTSALQERGYASKGGGALGGGAHKN